MPNEPFEIVFSITEEQWIETRRRRSDPGAEPIFDSFYGEVQITAGGVRLFGEGGYYLSIADLACGMAESLRAGFPYGQRTAIFRQADDSLEIAFELDDDRRVRLISNVVGSTPLSVLPQNFVSGTRSFIAQFVRQASARVPDALSWKDLKVLEPISESGSEPR